MEKNREISVQAAFRLCDLRLPDQLSQLSAAQCRELCAEIRQLLIRTVLKTGGHLSSNLGVVELTLALHRNFHSPQDRIVWDVGHQAYVHKLLTGRADLFPTLRQENGLSGFPKPAESPHDSFITGHSSTAVSAAFGMAEAMRLSGDNHFAVAVVGDGSMTGGMFYEGVNNAGKSRSNLIVILNDNNCAISKNVGAIAKYLTKIRNSTGYVRTKWRVEKVVGKTPVIGTKLVQSLKNSKDKFRRNIVETTIFDDLGFVYLGPVDGHDIEALDEVLTVAKSYRRPVLVHVRTIKGKGFKPAEENPGEYHGVPKGNAAQTADVDQIELASQNPELSVDECYSTVFGKALTAFAQSDPDICAVTAAMKYGTGLQFFAAAHPQRFFDVGIAEQHAVTFCAGLASMRKLPVFAVYSTFSQRAFDQIVNDAAIAQYHMVLGIDRAGLVGEDGETHQGIFDIPMLTAVPGCKIYSPASYAETEACLKLALYSDKGLAAVRYPRGKEPALLRNAAETVFSHIPGEDALLITYGRISAEAMAAADALKNETISCGLLRLVTVFPIPDEAFGVAQNYRRIIFFEEGSSAGGIAEKFAAALLQRGWQGQFSLHAIDGFVPPASVPRCLSRQSLDADAMCDAVRSLCNTKEEDPYGTA